MPDIPVVTYLGAMSEFIMMTMVTKLPPHRRITGAQRKDAAADASKLYSSGFDVRAIARRTGRSYGFVYNLLKGTGIQFRKHGGARR